MSLNTGRLTFFFYSLLFTVWSAKSQGHSSAIFLKRLIYYLLIFSYFTAVHKLSLVVASEGYCLAAVHELLISVASLAAEHGLQVLRLQ